MFRSLISTRTRKGGLDRRLSCVDDFSGIIKNGITGIGIRALLGVGQYLIGSLLGSGIRPALTDAVPFNRSRSLGLVVLREVPSLDDAAELGNVGRAGGVAAVFNDLHGLLVILAALEPIIAEFAAVLCA